MIRLHTLGTVDLTGRDGRPMEAVLARPKRLALLVYLAVASPRGFHRRDRLVATFWPEVDGDRARGSLNQAVYVLRRAVGATVLVSRGGEEIGLRDEGLWCDAREFEAALDSGRIEDALALYGGDLLDAFYIPDAPDFERWLEQERHRLRARASDAAWRLADQLAERGDLPKAAARARWAAALAPTDEAAFRRLLALLDRAGDRAGAVTAYDEFAARLRTEFDLAPSPETEAIVARLRHRDHRLAAARQPGPTPESETVGALPRSTEVAPSPAPSATTIAQRMIETPPGRATRGMRVWRWVAGALAIVALLGLMRQVPGWTADSRAPGGESVTVPVSGATLAVLPFSNLDGAAGTDYFTDGLAEEILGTLGRVEGLSVVARTSSFALKGARLDVREIGRRLGARYVLEGSVRTRGEHLRITAQLIDATTGYGVWSASWDRAASDVFAIQEELSRSIVDELRPRLLAGGASLDLVQTTRDLEAYDLYLRGRHHFNQRSVEDALKAVGYFEQAIARDSSFAQAHAGLADVLALLPYYRAARPAQVVERAKTAAKRAMAIDATLAEPHSTLGWIAFTYEWDWPTAEREFETALRLAPSYSNALHFYSLYLARVAGRHELAIAHVTRAQRLDPLAPAIHTGAGAVYYHARRFDRAIAAHRHALALDSSYSVARYMLGEAHLAAGRPEDALRELGAVQTGEVPSGDRIAALGGYALAMLGRRAEAARVLGNAKAAEISPVIIATLHAGLGERDSAFVWLARAADERDPAIVEMQHEPLLDPLRPDPRFRRLAARIGLP